ncbi:MAG: hypothetical protein PHO37_14315 [Kiritimatiellae bacterium]|nr:hypothetical protein [Kiritimatiellia bacterium]
MSWQPIIKISLSNAYRFDGSGTALAKSFRDAAGPGYLHSATVEMVFNPSDFSGNELLLESGGTKTGMSLSLNGSVLCLFNRYNNTTEAEVEFDLAELTPLRRSGFIHMVGVMDIDNDELYLYVNGELKDQATANGNLVEWTGTDPAGLGCANGAAAYPGATPSKFSGDIAILRLYSSVLSAEQVQGNYLALQPQKVLPGTVIMLQ